MVKWYGPKYLITYVYIITWVGTCVGSHHITYTDTQSCHHEGPFPLRLSLGKLCHYPQVPAEIVSSQAARISSYVIVILEPSQGIVCRFLSHAYIIYRK